MIFTACAATSGGCTLAPRPLSEDADLIALKAKVIPEPHRLAIAPVELPSTAYDLKKEPGVYGAKIDGEQFQRELAAAINDFTGFAAPAVLREADRKAAFVAAHAAGADVLVCPRFTRFEVAFDGRNGWWPLSAALYLYAWVPSWVVPDEDYRARADLELAYYSVATERLLYTTAACGDEQKLRADVVKSLNNFERGWSIFGIFFDPRWIDEGDMQHVDEKLNAHARLAIEKAAALEVGGRLAAGLRDEALLARDAGVFALLVGVSRYRDEAAIDGAEGAAKDVTAMRAVLEQRLGIPARNIETLEDAGATREAILGRVRGFLAARARPQDVVLVYFSGCGAPAADAEDAYLLPCDASAADLAGTAISLRALGDELHGLPAQRSLLVLDASFAGRRGAHARSAEVGAGAPLPDAALARLSAPLAPTTTSARAKTTDLLTAAGPDEPALDLAEAHRGLMSYFLAEGAGGAAAGSVPGRVTLEELAAYVARLVPAEAGIEGASQTPRLYRGGRRVLLGSPSPAESWLPDLRAQAR